MVKGSHIVVPRLYDHARAYILPTRDRSVVFTLPFERDYTLIGTTDVDFSGDPRAVLPSGEEIDYLCEAANDYFRAPIVAADMVWAFAGVRALYARRGRKPQDLRRDPVLILDKRYGEAPVLTLYSGSLAMYRRVAEDVLRRLGPFFPPAKPWTAQTPLPGGDFAHDGMPALIEETRRRWPFLTTDHARRLTRAYGTRVKNILKTATRLDDLGLRFGGDLTARGSALPDEQGVGADRRRRALAALEARLARFRDAARHARPLHDARQRLMAAQRDFRIPDPDCSGTAASQSFKFYRSISGEFYTLVVTSMGKLRSSNARIAGRHGSGRNSDRKAACSAQGAHRRRRARHAQGDALAPAGDRRQEHP